MKKLEVLGLNGKKIGNIVNELPVLLADLQVSYSNLCSFHWNVKGHGFFALHSKYEELYNDTAKKVDEVVERTLRLDSTPKNHFSVYLQTSGVREINVASCSEEALGLLLDYYKTLTVCERRIIDPVAEAHDGTTTLSMNDFLVDQEKTVRMLAAVSPQNCVE